MFDTCDINFGSRFQFPENMQIECNGSAGSISSEILVKMVDKYDTFVANQIAMEARAEGVSDLTILNKTAILEALKKQISQQVIISIEECLCPACGYDMMGLWDFPDVQEPNFCPMCGQRLRWRKSLDQA